MNAAMPGRTMTLTFPDFRGFIRAMVLACTGVYLVQVVLERAAPVLYNSMQLHFALIPAMVLEHLWVWQLVTYLFLHGGVTHLLFNMLSLWFVGAYLEQAIGQRKVAEGFFLSAIGGGLLTVLASLLPMASANAFTPVIGASGGILGLLAMFAVLFGDQQFYMFPLPFAIKAKYLVVIYVVFDLLSFLTPGSGGIAYLAHLGGAATGYLYIKTLGRRRASRSVTTTGSEAFYGLRNAWYRWKRRRAAKKFEVYMRRHGGR